MKAYTNPSIDGIVPNIFNVMVLPNASVKCEFKKKKTIKGSAAIVKISYIEKKNIIDVKTNTDKNIEKMKKYILITFLLLNQSLISFAQTDQKEVEKVIATLFEGMKSKNPVQVEQAFLKDALMQTTIIGEEGASINSNSVQDFVTRIATTPDDTILDERITEYQIKIDGHMASAWTPYRFYVNDEFSHCGVNSFQLIYTSEGWKIAYIIDTRRKIGC